ncbi:MAG: beta-hydroxyacyl-ACP dehydratase [Phycisphaerae bacterium]|nr:beta-hydroxyacyl-ACP dehydratase [Phycisphaerae bacterium]
MSSPLLFDISEIDLSKVEFGIEEILKENPQSFEMSQLDAVNWSDLETLRCVGYKDITENEFWIRGHIPGRPIMPGVIMVEAAAQLASFFMKRVYGLTGFIGFSGIEKTKFRGTVVPGDRLYMLSHICKVRSRQFSAEVEGIVDGKKVFDTIITGMRV